MYRKRCLDYCSLKLLEIADVTKNTYQTKKHSNFYSRINKEIPCQILI